MKIGIVVDNYKASKYEAKLKENNYVFTSDKYQDDLTAFYVFAEKSELEKINAVCFNLETEFKLNKRHNKN